jgi:hypothetical protein
MNICCDFAKHLNLYYFILEYQKRMQIKYKMHEVTEHSNSVRVARDLINWQVKKEREKDREIGYKDPRTN